MAVVNDRARARMLFAESVQLTDGGCLLWTGSVAAGEVPVFTAPGARGPVNARRWLWIDEGFPDPGPKHLFNRCGNRMCVHPGCSYTVGQEAG